MKKVYALKYNCSPKSASGAAFPLICKELKKQGAEIVYGAAFDDNFRVCHIRVDLNDKTELERLKGSKYVESSLNTSYLACAKDLLSGKKVIFSGVPCQIAGLYTYLKNEGIGTSNLYSIDLICHGTPKKKIWEDFVRLIEHQENARITEFSFRGKRAAVFSNGHVYMSNHQYISQFRNLFQLNLDLNKRCFSCRFRNDELDRPADITIGDFWGVRECIPSLSKVSGEVSLVMPNTQKGIDLIKNIAVLQCDSKDYIIIENKSPSFLVYNPHLNSQTPIPKRYDAFWSDYEKLGLEPVLKKYGRLSFLKSLRRKTIDFLDKKGLKYKIKKIMHK